MKSTKKESIFVDLTGATYKPRKPWRCKLCADVGVKTEIHTAAPPAAANSERRQAHQAAHAEAQRPAPDASKKTRPKGGDKKGQTAQTRAAPLHPCCLALEVARQNSRVERRPLIIQQ